MNSKKTIISVVLVLLILGGAAYYFLAKKDNNTTATNNTINTQTEDQAQEETTEPAKATDMESAIAAWKAAGLTVSADKGVAYQMVNASNGGKYDVGTTNVELYEYENAVKAEEAKQSSFFVDPADTVFVTGTLLVVVHSNDPATVDPVKAVF